MRFLEMPVYREEPGEMVAAVASCPAPDCGWLVFEYRDAGSNSAHWEFSCGRCGAEFTVGRGELLFESAPKQWLAARTYDT